MVEMNTQEKLMNAKIQTLSRFDLGMMSEEARDWLLNTLQIKIETNNLSKNFLTK